MLKSPGIVCFRAEAATANSNAMQGVMHGSVYKPGIQKIDQIRIALGVVSVAGLGLIGFTGWRNHVKRKAERAEAAAANEE